MKGHLNDMLLQRLDTLSLIIQLKYLNNILKVHCIGILLWMAIILILFLPIYYKQ